MRRSSGRYSTSPQSASILMYNSRLKDFHYILDETKGVAEMFVPAPRTDRILIGKRTGFAFYRDHHLDRKILIGVYEGNMRANTYFDGPFDQLPDAFVKGDTLRNAILDVEPKLTNPWRCWWVC